MKNIEKFFLADKSKGKKLLCHLYKMLDKKVSEYYEISKPLLKGQIAKYYPLINNKNLSYMPKSSEEIIKDFSQFFQRAVIWENSGTMINITPPVNILSVVTSFYSSLYNPNFAQDESSGYLMTSELIVSKYLSELVHWDWKKSKGILDVVYTLQTLCR